MTRIETLMQEAEDAPEELIEETVDFLRFLKCQCSRKADNDEWSERKLHDDAARSFQYAAQLYGDEEDLLPVDGTEDKHAATK